MLTLSKTTRILPLMVLVVACSTGARKPSSVEGKSLRPFPDDHEVQVDEGMNAKCDAEAKAYLKLKGVNHKKWKFKRMRVFDPFITYLKDKGMVAKNYSPIVTVVYMPSTVVEGQTFDPAAVCKMSTDGARLDFELVNGDKCSILSSFQHTSADDKSWQPIFTDMSGYYVGKSIDFPCFNQDGERYIKTVIREE